MVDDRAGAPEPGGQARSPEPAGGQRGQPAGVEAACDAPILRAAHLIASWRRILVASHRDPDGDALGASLGLTLALRARGCEVTAVNADPPIESTAQPTPMPFQRTGLAAIPGTDLIVSWSQIDDQSFDGVILVDCGTLDRLHSDPDIPCRILERSRDLLVIDHHLAPSHRYHRELESIHAGETIRIVDSTRASSAELVALVIEAAGLPMDREVATALLTGIATDTKGFLRDSTDARTLACASRLRMLGGGVSIAEDILQRHSLGFLVLAGDVLSRAVITEGGAGIVASIPEELLAASRVRDGEVEMLTALLSNTREAYVIVVLQGQADGIRGSVRTRAPIDAVAIAQHFGGGGHARRSGFRVPRARLDDVRDEVGVVVRAAVSTLNGRLNR